MAERPVLVGLIPQVVVLDPGDQVSWISDAGNLRVEFDSNRCPFSSNIFQAPVGMRLLSGPAVAGTKPGSYEWPTTACDTQPARSILRPHQGRVPDDNACRAAPKDRGSRAPSEL